MIGAEFDYQSPRDLTGLLELLGRGAEQAKLLGGGMTLVPMLNLGLVAPDLLIGLRGIEELSQVGETDEHVVVGAMVRHCSVAADPLIRGNAPLLSLAAGLIGDVQVRNRGTLGGSLAHADPAANYLPAVIALEAGLKLASPRGRRIVPAKEFFHDLMTTALEDDEVITSVCIAKSTSRMGCGFQKFTRVKGNFPIVCAAALVDPQTGDGRLTVGGVMSVPLTVEVHADAPGRDELADAIRAAIADPLEDLNGDGEYKREMAVVFGLRALADAARDARRKGDCDGE